MVFVEKIPYQLSAGEKASIPICTIDGAKTFLNMARNDYKAILSARPTAEK